MSADAYFFYLCMHLTLGVHVVISSKVILHTYRLFHSISREGLHTGMWLCLSVIDLAASFLYKTINVNTKVPNSIMDLTSCITSDRILLKGIVS